MPNQYKPLPPENDIRDPFMYYYECMMPDTEIAIHLRDHYDTDIYGLGVKSVKRLREKWGLKSTRQQKHSFDTFGPKIQELRKRFPGRGAEGLRRTLFQQYNYRVSRVVISRYLKLTEPDAVDARRRKLFKRRVFYAAGVCDLWVMDQHDKWGPRYGLWLHNSLDPFSGYNNWLKVWWTNKNPRLIAKYYLDAAREQGAIPLVTQSDPGSENFGVANAHTLAHHELDPTLVGTLQHRWKHKTHNVKSEANWSVLRRTFSPGFQDMLEEGVKNGLYDVDIYHENLVFRWLAIPFIQAELDEWRVLRNRTAPRKNKHKILPHGIPEIIRHKPDKFGARDFKIPVPIGLIDRLEQQYAPPSHPVFELVPEAFDACARDAYNTLQCPSVDISSFWDVYQGILAYFNDSLARSAHLQVILARNHTIIVGEAAGVPLLPGLKPLREGENLIGNWEGDGEGEPVYGDFSDESGDGSGDGS
ncbi:hypothetical protein JOM56_004152 [Amanita muscaria]